MYAPLISGSDSYHSLRERSKEHTVSTKLRFFSPEDSSRMVLIELRTLLTLILDAMVLSNHSLWSATTLEFHWVGMVYGRLTIERWREKREKRRSWDFFHPSKSFPLGLSTSLKLKYPIRIALILIFKPPYTSNLSFSPLHLLASNSMSSGLESKLRPLASPDLSLTNSTLIESLFQLKVNPLVISIPPPSHPISISLANLPYLVL